MRRPTMLPWFEVADPDASARITVRHLLDHASGLSDLRYREALRLPNDDLTLVLLANQSTLPMALFAYADLSTGLLDLLVGATPAPSPFTLRAAIGLVPHFVTAPVAALVVIAALETWMGRGISLRQAFDGVPDLALMLAVGFAADLALGGWMVTALARGRGRLPTG